MTSTSTPAAPPLSPMMAHYPRMTSKRASLLKNVPQVGRPVPFQSPEIV